MKFVRLIDENGWLLNDDFVVELTEFTITTPCPDGMYKQRWDGTQWFEGLSQAEIDSIKSVAPEPTQEERLKAVEDAMFERLLGGTI